jgi:glutamyl-tRNA synthetase
LIAQLDIQENWNNAELEQTFKVLSGTHELKHGELMLPFRIMLVGGKFGPTVFEIAALIGKTETTNRIKHVLNLLS